MEEIELTYWEMVAADPSILLPLVACYVAFCWGCPLLCCLDEGIRPYWKSVLQISAACHLVVLMSLAAVFMITVMA